MKQLVTYLPHVYPFSIVEMNEQKLVVLSNDKGRLRLYDPATSIEYPHQSEPLYIIAGPSYCAELVVRRRLWLKWGDFSIAPNNCTSAQALIKLAWYYVHHNMVQTDFPTMYFSPVDGTMKRSFEDNDMGFMDAGGISKTDLMKSLWIVYTVHHLGVTTHQESLLAWDKFEKEFKESLSLVDSFSLPSHKVSSLQENSIIFYNGEVGYLTDYAAPPRLIVPKPGQGRSKYPAYPDATAYVLMTPSQCAHSVLEFGLTD